MKKRLSNKAIAAILESHLKFWDIEGSRVYLYTWDDNFNNVKIDLTGATLQDIRKYL